MSGFATADVSSAQAATPTPQLVYDLLAAGEPAEALGVIDQIARTASLSQALKEQKVYILLQLNRVEEASDWLNSFEPDPTRPESYALLQAIVAERLRDFKKAYAGYRDLSTSPNEIMASQARAHLDYLPDVAREDKWLWGSFDGYGTYYGRYGLVAGQANLKVGTFIPGARWIQPYAAFSYQGDTRSSASGSPLGLSNLYSQNFSSLMLGVNIKPFSQTNVNFYVQGGANKDLIDSPRHEGDWYAAIQAGVNGYDSWGPGSVLRTHSDIGFTGDWFVDFGGDFSYYSRVPNAIAYIQSRQGFRLMQFGHIGAFDAYLIENLAFDTRGGYFNNFMEFGPGARFIFQPFPRVSTSLDAAYFVGSYMGRNDLEDRGGRDLHYDEARVTASVSWHW